MKRRIHRRDFITMLGGAAAVSAFQPRPARAQQRVPVIGFLCVESADAFAGRLQSFKQGLSQAGFVEGRNVAIEYRWAEGRIDRLPALAADLVQRQVDVIATAGASPAALAAQRATATIPIVFQVGADPVAIGLVVSLNRPGGNLTGVTSLNTELGPKRVELLHEMVPGARLFSLLMNPASAQIEAQLREFEAAAHTLGLQLHVVRESRAEGIAQVFAETKALGAGGVVIGSDPLFVTESKLMADAALRQGVPAISPYDEFVPAGGLMSYGGSIRGQYRLVGIYTGRILKGEKPADLPVEQVTKVELIINMKTAKALGITFPITLLGRADEVIE